MIPKKLHYCWFGGNEMSPEIKQCIKSWQIYLPDYEICRWDETNYDINKVPYIKQAYEEKKWAFVTDYVRLDICYTYGGIYLDTDVEVVKNFDDLLGDKAFVGVEYDKKNNTYLINTGLVLGMEKDFELGKILRDDYINKEFRDVNGKLNMTPCPVIQTKKMKKMGYNGNNSKQIISNLIIYPQEFFCPLDQYTGELNITNNTYSVHHYHSSWISEVDKVRRCLRVRYSKYGGFVANVLSLVIANYQCFGLLKMWGNIGKKLKGLYFEENK